MGRATITEMVSCRLLFALLGMSSLVYSAVHPAGYVGSKACFACHEGIYREFLKTDMGRSMRAAADIDSASLPAGASVAVGSSNRTLRVFHDQTGWHQSETQPDVFSEEHSLQYAIGSGANGLTFLIRRGNYLFQAPLSFYSRAGKWDISPGYESADIGFTRAVPEACISCHTGRAQPVANRNGEYLDPPFAEVAIGCENCHGPGAQHTMATGRAPIGNPGKLPPRLAEEVCMNCHQRGDTRILQPGKTYADFHPGQWLLDTLAIFKAPKKPGEQSEPDLLEHGAAMKASRCFRESAGKLSCFSCHDPHRQPRGSETASYYREKCLACHTDSSCRLAKDVRLKHEPSNDCAGCHMPKRNLELISHSALTNHRIPARPDEPMPQEEPPDPKTGLILVNRSSGRNAPVPDLTLLRAYGELAPRDTAYERRYLDLLEKLSGAGVKEPFVQAALGHKALAEHKDEEALAHLTAAVPLDDSTVYRDTAQALINLGRAPEAVDYLKRAETIDPFNPVVQKTLILQYINLKRYPDARQAMEAYVKTFPADVFMRSLLARVSN
jgi:hypothetical protein